MTPRTQSGPRSMLRPGARGRGSERESVRSGQATRAGERLKTHLDLWHPVPSLGLGACCPPGPGYGVPNVRVLAPARRLGPASFPKTDKTAFLSGFGRPNFGHFWNVSGFVRPYCYNFENLATR